MQRLFDIAENDNKKIIVTLVTVVLANGFLKKMQKTPKQEIETALKIKAEYESEK